MAGIELVTGKDSGKPLPAGNEVAARVEEAARRNGLIVKFVGNRIALAPAYIVSAEEIGEIGSRLEKALDEVNAGIGA